ncbi:MAG: GNAT family N-acetyltransferase [Gammaproteobacteria bacterium]|nr:GNAT family N-acetyltransferase [Gammaproteobacteria bacterium]
MTYHVTIFEAFDDAKSSWQVLEQHGDGYAFQTWAWSRNWFELVGKNRGIRPCIALVDDETGPLMLLPLAIEPRRLHNALVWLGDELADYHGPVLGKGWAASDAARDFSATWRDVCTALPSHDLVSFEKQPATIGEQPNPFVHLAALPTRPHPAQAYFATLGESLDEFLRSRRKARSLQSDRRKERKLAEHGRLEFVVAETPAQIAPLLKAMIEQKTRSYAALGVANLFDEPGCVEFITKMTVDHPDAVRLFGLTLDDEPIATLWGPVSRGRYYHLFPTYAHNELMTYSPGNILLKHAFGWCIDNGINTYDFTVGDEDYKQHWCQHQLRLFDADLGVTLRGKVFALLNRTRTGLKRFVKESPALFAVAKRARSLLGKIKTT